MRSRADVLKGGLIIGAATAVALLSGAHALSSASVRNSPELAAAIWPANGLALEKLAYDSFVEDVRKVLIRPENFADDRSAGFAADLRGKDDELRRLAGLQHATAVQALAYEPLLPKAHAILALSDADPVRRQRIVELASKLNRRDLPLQGLVLQSKVNSNDYAGTIETLDQILRVHPERGAEFFPLLTKAMQQPVTIPAFRDLLSRPIPWRDAFLKHAVMDPVAARNLATIRRSLSIDNPAFDKALTVNLVRGGEVAAAADLYRRLAGSSSSKAGAWSSDLPPFDWTFASEAGMRAQPSKDGRSLEFAIDPGSGGVLASRLVPRPARPFTVMVEHQLASGSSAKDLKLTLMCLGGTGPFFETTFTRGKDSFDVRQAPGCDYMLLALSGRAWTGATPLNGSVSSVRILPR